MWGPVGHSHEPIFTVKTADPGGKVSGEPLCSNVA